MKRYLMTSRVCSTVWSISVLLLLNVYVIFLRANLSNLCRRPLQLRVALSRFKIHGADSLLLPSDGWSMALLPLQVLRLDPSETIARRIQPFVVEATACSF